MKDSTNSKRVYDIIKKKILSCEYQPNQVISEKEIVESLDAGRTPVREALNILNGKGLLKILPKKGIQIANLSRKRMLEIYEIRSLLEPLSISQAIPLLKPEDYLYLTELDNKLRDSMNKGGIMDVFKVGMDFHLHIARVSRNETLYQILEGLRYDNFRGLVFYLTQYLDRANDEERQNIINLLTTGHKSIIEALQDKDEARAIEHMKEDLYNANQMVTKFYI